MEVKTDAIVLKAVDYKDNDKILTLFSPSLGRITAGAKGVKKPKAKLSFSAQPFCFAEYVLAEKGGRYTVTGAYLHESFFSLLITICLPKKLLISLTYPFFDNNTSSVNHAVAIAFSLFASTNTIRNSSPPYLIAKPPSLAVLLRILATSLRTKSPTS